MTVISSPRTGSGLRLAGTAVLVAQLVVLTGAAWLVFLYARSLAATGALAPSPDALVPFGAHAANPLAWLNILAGLTVLLGDGVAALLALTGLALALLTDLRHDRRRSRTLLVTSLLCVAVVVILNTGIGADLHHWFIPD